jgi:hypothetical protein
MKFNMKTNVMLAAIAYLLTLSTHLQAGELLYAKGFTPSQKAQVKVCYKQEKTFPQQVRKLTTNGDIVVKSMHKQRDGYLFMTITKAHDKWINHTPLKCDLRSDAKKKSDHELKLNQEEKRALKIQQEQKIKQDTANKKSLEAKQLADSKAQTNKQYQEAQAQKAKRIAYRQADVRKQAVNCKDQLLATINIPNNPAYKTTGNMQVSGNHIVATVEVAKYSGGLKRSIKNHTKKCKIKPTVYPPNI